MKLTIIGASAGTGLLTLQQALDRGHQVTAMARNTTLLPEHPQLTKITGDATSVADLKRAITGADAVLITVGTKKKNATSLFTDLAHALKQVATQTEMTMPVLVVTGFGAGDSRPYLNLFMGLVIRLFLRKEYDDKSRLETLLADSGLRWEIVRPGMLANGPLTEHYQIITQLHRGIRVGKISRADVAHFLLNQAENPTLLYQHPALTS